MNDSNVWLVTGASKGLGFELVKHLLDKGYRVAATSRDASKISLNHKNLLPLSMEVVDEDNVKKAVDQVIKHFGRLDVLVNNAGYGLLGGIEELSDKEIRNEFDVNVFGLLNVSRAVLPIFRKQKSGCILNIASVSGSVSVPATGIYSATKAAVIQISEALAKETEEFGVKVVAVCPGGFRTDFLDQSSMVTSKEEIADYSVVRNVITRFAELNKNQGGDPKKAAEVFIKLAEMEQPPVRFYMGSDALRMMAKKIDEISTSIEENKQLSHKTDY